MKKLKRYISIVIFLSMFFNSIDLRNTNIYLLKDTASETDISDIQSEDVASGSSADVELSSSDEDSVELIETVQPVQTVQADTVTSQNAVSIAAVEAEDLTVSEDLTLDSDLECENLYLSAGILDLNGYTLTVYGDVEQTRGTLNIDAGSLYIQGNYSMGTSSSYSRAYLNMTTDNDYVYVGGNMLVNSYYSHSDYLTAGTIELCGDFTQLTTASYSSYNFDCSGSHKVILSGTETQTISFENPKYSGFNILEINGSSKKNFTTDFRAYTIQGDDITGGNFGLITDTCDLNVNIDCSSFSVSGADVNFGAETIDCTDCSISGGSLVLNGGKLNVGEDLNQTKGTLNLSGGTVTIAGSYYIGTETKYAQAYLIMTNDDDYVYVGGDMLVNSYYSHSNYLTAGTIELCGDFTQLTTASYSSYNFDCSGSHKVILSGTETQIISFENPKYSGFNILEINGSSEKNFTTDFRAYTIQGNDITGENFGLITDDCDLNVNVDCSSFSVSGADVNFGAETISCTECSISGGSLVLNGGKLNVDGDLNQTKGTLNLSGGTITIAGSYYIGTETKYAQAYLIMTNDDDYVYVGGDMLVNSYCSHSNYLTAGTLELCGNFTQLSTGTYSSYNFNCTGSHKVILSGIETQTISFENDKYSGFNELYLNGSQVYFDSYVRINSISQDTNGRFLNLEISNGTCELQSDINADCVDISDGEIDLNGYTLNVSGSFMQTGGTLNINGGNAVISQNYYIGNETTYALAYLNMTNDNDYIYVGGDMLVNSYYSHSNYLTAGTLELCGDFTQLSTGTYSTYNFNCTNTHKVILSGTETQTISFENDKYSGFNELYLNGSQVYFDSYVRINGISQDADSRFLNLEISNGTCELQSDINANCVDISGGEIDLNGYTLNTSENFTQTGGTFNINSGSAIINQNYYIGDKTTYALAYLNMTNEDDYIYVGGDMLVNSYYNHSNYLTDGVLEICGNFTQLSTGSYHTYNFNCTGNHKAILNGEEAQSIYFEDYPHSKFNVLYTLQNDENYTFSPECVWDSILSKENDEDAPQTVSDITLLSSSTSSVSFEWTKPDDDDILGYKIYRDGEYLGKVYKTCYTDNTITGAGTYIYNIAVFDIAGNQSENSEDFEVTVLSDSGFPTVKSINPEPSDLSSNTSITAVLCDDEELSNVSLYYGSSTDNDWTLIESRDISGTSQTVSFYWYASELESGSYDIKITVSDISGNITKTVYNGYTLHNDLPEEPVLSASAGNLSAVLNWTAADNILYYKLYRSTDEGDTYKYITKVTDTSYTDKNLSADSIYYYFINAVNEYGNSSTSNTVSVTPNSVDEQSPKANAGFDTSCIVNEEISFTGSNSTDNVGIESYSWDFGDGSSSDEANPTHIYTELTDDYNYTVTLTVTDAAGNSDTDTITVTVYPEDQVGTLNLTVKNSSGSKLSNAYVFVDLSDDGQKIYMTDSNGIAKISAMAGSYNISAYYQGYLPNEENFTIEQYKTTSGELVLSSGDIVEQQVSVTPMTLEEIEEAGIDTSDPDNQYVYRIETTLVFEDQTIILSDVVVSGTGTIYSGGGTTYYAASSTSGGYSSGVSGTGGYISNQIAITTTVIANESHPEVAPTLAYLVIPTTVSWLKEFFSVQMILVNQAASQFSIQNSYVTLDLPDGLSLADTAETQSLTVNLGEIAGQETASTEWIIRGDVSGTYDINAHFTGVLMPFEADVEADFTTEEAITVYGEKAVKVYVYPEDTAYVGEIYYVEYEFVNVSNKDIYNFDLYFNLDGEEASSNKTYILETAENQKYLPHLKAGDTLHVDVLEAGESIRGIYETIIDFPGEPGVTFYKLIDTIITQLSDEEIENIPVTVIPVQSSKIAANSIGGATYSYQLGVLKGQEDLSFDMTYNSLIDDEGNFGYGWLFNYAYSIEQEDNKYALVMPDGTKYYFSPDYEIRGELTDDEVTVNVNSMILNGFTPITRGSANYELDVTGSGYTVTTGDNKLLTFNSDGELESIETKTGYGLSFERTSSSLKITEDNSGNYLTAYTNDDGYITSVTDTTGTYTFSYEDDLLKTAVNPDNGKTSFDYTDNRLASVTQYNSSNNSSTVFSYEYDEDGYISSVTDRMGSSKTYSYDKTSEFWRIIVDETDRLGYHSIKEFNRFGELVSSEDALGGETLYTYDSNGNLASTSDPNGNTVIYDYDDDNNLISITDALNRTIYYTYDDMGNMLSETDAAGYTAEYTYYDNNLLKSAKDKNGYITSYSYDDYGNMLSVSCSGKTAYYTYEDCLLVSSTDFNGNTTSYSYTDWILTSVTDALGNITNCGYDDMLRLNEINYPDGTNETWYYNCLGNLEVYKDRNNNSTAYGYNNNNDLIMVTVEYAENGDNDTVSYYTYDAEDQLLSIKDFDGNVTSLVYDAAGNIISSSDGNDVETKYTYDAAKRLLSTEKGNVITKYGYFKTGELQSITDAYDNKTTYTYDNAGNIAAVANALNLAEAYEYDGNGNVTKVTTPQGFTNTYTYDFRNNITSFTDANGNKAVYTYDDNGNRITEEYAYDDSKADSERVIVKYTYDALNRLTGVTDANGYTTDYEYNSAGYITGINRPSGVSSSYTYDGKGNVKEVYDSSNVLVQQTDYDYLNNPIKITDALGNSTEYKYNAIGEMISYTTPRNNTYTYTYDGNSSLISEKDPLEGIVEYGYDDLGNTTEFTDANGNTTVYDYDSLNRLISETSAAEYNDSYVYNEISDLISYINKRGQITEYTYDNDSRMTSKTTVEGGVTYKYDNNGNLLTVTDENGTITRVYDDLNRVISYEDANGNVIRYEYDNAGNLTKLTYPDDKEVVYTYNADNQLLTVTDWNNRVTAYDYDNNGRLISETRPDGSVQTYTYDAAGQLTYTVDKTADGTVINEYSYEYDADGNITAENSANEPTAESIGIDSAEMNYGAANQLTEFNGTAISYDADGNMLNTPLDNEFANLTYNSLNYLTDVVTSDSAVSYSFTYDAEGYRKSKTENGTAANFVVNPNSALSQVLMSTTGEETTYYIYGLGLIEQENSEGYKIYHYDYRGSTTSITDETGNITDTVYYDPYGNIISRTGTTDTPFLYVGKYGVETDDCGLYYMRARYYNPTIQRFINVDPVKDGYNWYSYVEGNPVINVDLYGLVVYTYGVNGAIGVGAVISGSAAIAIDDKGNAALVIGFGFGGGIAANLGTSFILFPDMESVKELQGTSSSVTAQFFEYQNTGKYSGYTLPTNGFDKTSVLKTFAALTDLSSELTGIDLKVSISYSFVFMIIEQ